MRRLVKWLLPAFMLAFYVQTAYPQNDLKLLNKEIKKEIKRLTKKGWKPAFGTSTLSEQVTMLMEKRLDYGDDGVPRFLIGKGLVEGRMASADYNMAHRQAEELARTGLGSLIESHVSSSFKSVIDGSNSSFESISQVKSRLRMLCDEEEVVADFVRQLSDGRYEVMVYLVLNCDSINKIIKEP